MKTCLAVAGAVLLTTGCSSIHRMDSSQYQVISVPEGLRDGARLADAAQSLKNGTPVIFKMINGEQMPLKLAVDLPMGAVRQGDCSLAFKHDTYLFLSQRDCLLSPDGQRWASIRSPKAVAKLFGTKRGAFRLGFGSATNEEPFMSVEIKAE